MDQPYPYPSPEPGPRQTTIHRLSELPPPEEAPVFHLAPGVTEERISVGRILWHLFLFALTVLTTCGVGMLWFHQEGQPPINSLRAGMVYSFSLIVILTAHEMGHYIACRWYGVAVTLPYFIPVPLPPVGTFGAFIKIKAPIPTRRALFDIGIAGPLAGFIFVIPAAWIAHYFAEPAVATEMAEGAIYFQSPLLFKFFEWLFGLPEMVELNPVMWAAWVGALMTSLNLLPVGQLDGGHVTYALFGARGHRFVALICYLAVIGLALFSLRDGVWNWVVYAVILTLLMRVGHPPVMEQDETLGRGRTLVALIGLIVFILCFMPVPIRF